MSRESDYIDGVNCECHDGDYPVDMPPSPEPTHRQVRIQAIISGLIRILEYEEATGAEIVTEPHIIELSGMVDFMERKIEYHKAIKGVQIPR